MTTSAEIVTENIRHENDVGLLANWALFICGVADVASCTHQLGMGIANIQFGKTPIFEIANDRSTGQTVVDLATVALVG